MLNHIVACSANNVIGRDNKIPWHLPEDLKRFKALTQHHTVVMGRKTYESIGKPLPKRRNIVVSTTMPVTPGVEVVRSIAEALSAASSDEQVFIIGGARLYSETISIADQLYLTRLLADYDGDTYYPDVPQTFYIAAQEDHGDFTYLTYKKRK